MDKYSLLFGMLLGFALNILIMWLKTKSKTQKQSIEIFKLPNDNFHMIINGLQYRFVENKMHFHYSKVYSFPSGVKCFDDSNYLRYLIAGFKEQEQADVRKKEYEAEMFLGLSDSFSKWDKEFSTKALNK